MIFVAFGTSPNRFAIAGARILEVVPLVPLRRLTGAPAALVGTFSYHGDPIGVIDLELLLAGRPSVEHLSTRILVVTWGAASRVGLIAERATDVLQSESDPAPSDIDDPANVGELLSDGEERVLVLDIDRLLSSELQAALCGDAMNNNGGP